MSASVWQAGTAISANNSIRFQPFVATANQTLFEIPPEAFAYVPGTSSLLVFQSSGAQRPGIDFTETSSSSFTMTTPVAEGTIVLAMAFVGITSTLDALQLRTDLANASDPSKGATLVGFKQEGVGSVVRTTTAKLQETVSVRDFGVLGDGTDEYAGILAAWQYCLANGKDLYFPAGVYSSGVNNMPFKNPVYPAVDLLDCKNITIHGDGPSTTLKSDSVSGADTLNLYSVKNLHICNMKITADLSGFAGSGSNGLSIVGGFDNLTFDRLWFEDLPYVEKAGPNYLDGGKAFTIQTGTPATECGTIKATHIYAKGCVYGLGIEIDLVNFAAKKHAIDVDIVVEDCYHGVVVSAGEASGALSSGMTMGVKISGQLINCQRDVVLGRAHGVQVNAQVITTKSIAARRLNPSGDTWATFDTIVDTLICTYAKNSQIKIVGDKSNCDYIAQIGGATAGASGLGAYSEHCQIFLDVEGVAATAAINLVSSGGDTIKDSDICITTQTAASLPGGFYTQSLNNTVTVGPSKRFISPTIAGALNFAYTDGITTYNTLERDSFGMYFKQTGGSSADVIITGAKDHAGVVQYGIRNDGMLVTQGRATATAVATVKQVMPIYDNANALVGYVPIYTSYTP